MGIVQPCTDLVPTLGRARKVRIKRSDVYQMAAYRRHHRWSGSPGALIYPVALGKGETYQRPYRVTGFNDPIHIVFLDVGPDARRNLRAFHQTVAAHDSPRVDQGQSERSLTLDSTYQGTLTTELGVSP